MTLRPILRYGKFKDGHVPAERDGLFHVAVMVQVGVAVVALSVVQPPWRLVRGHGRRSGYGRAGVP